MALTIIADDPIKSALRQSLEVVWGNNAPDATIVYLETRSLANVRRSEFAGLDEVLRLAPTTSQPIIMVSMMPAARLADDPRWQGAMGYPNVNFCDALQAVACIPIAITGCQIGVRPRDEVAIRIAGRKVTQSAVGTLRHDLRYAQNEGGERLERWLALARQTFGDISQAELEAKVAAWAPEGEQLFAGESLPGTFVDIEGTLIKDGQINPKMQEVLHLAVGAGPVTIWTDADIKAVSSTIRAAGITVKILPKSIFRGAIVETAYDDLSEAEFERLYDISVDNYHQV